MGATKATKPSIQQLASFVQLLKKLSHDVVSFTHINKLQNTNRLTHTHTEYSTMAWMNSCSAIHSTKVCPIFPSDVLKSESFRSINGVYYNIGDYEYWQARRAFLSSYHFTRRKYSFKDWFKKSFKGVGKMAMSVYFGVIEEFSKRKISIKVYKLTLVWPRLFIARCYICALSL